MNSFLKLSNDARAFLMRQTAMDELDYQLLVLETGSNFLGLAVCVSPLIDQEVAVQYREHLTTQGFWDWFAYTFRRMEVDLWKQWTREDDLMMLQPASYKRARLLAQANGINFQNATWNAFEVWLGTIDLRMKLPADTATQTQH